MNNPFDTICLRVAPDQRNYKWGRGKTVHAYNPATGTASRHSEPWFNPFFRADDYRYYLVNPDQRATCLPIAAEINDSVGQARIVDAVLSIQGIEPSHVSDMIAALAREDAPFNALSALVAEWLQQFVNQKRLAKIDALARMASTGNEAMAAREECAQFVASQALNQLGLRLSCELRLPEEDLQLEPISMSVPVLVSDNEEELEAQLHLRIHPPETAEERTLALERLLPVERIKEAIKMRTMQWFRLECKLDDFCYNESAVRQPLEGVLKRYIEDELRRKLFGFRVTCKVPFDTEFLVPQDYSVTCRVQPETEVPVQHQLLIEKSDIAQFRRKKISDLKQWIEKTLDRHTRAVLFDKKYADVIVNFESLAEDIKRRVEEDVKQIGFNVTQLITIPRDPLMQSVVDRKLAFKTEPARGEFKTKDSSVVFKLTLQVRVKFIDLDRVKLFLKKGNALHDQFSNETVEAVGEVIRQLDPACLHTEFDLRVVDVEDFENSMGLRFDPELDIPAGEFHAERKLISPEELIKASVKKRLREELHSSVDSIFVSVEETEVAELFRLLHARIHHLDVAVETRGQMGEKLVFHFDYRIRAIAAHGWPKFQNHCRTAQGATVPEKATVISDSVNGMLRNAATGRIESDAPAFLRSGVPSWREGVQARALNDAIKQAADHFGLTLEIMSRSRELSEWERRERERAQQDYEEIVERKRGLQLRYRDLQTELPPDDPQLQELKSSIDTCNTALNDFATGHDEIFKKLEAALPPVPIEKMLPLPTASVDETGDPPKYDKTNGD
jgi:hypothetical protein